MQYPDFSSFKTRHVVKDYTVSQEEFELKHWQEFDMLVTYPQPSDDVLGAYYESDEYISHTDSKSSFVDRAYQLVKQYMLQRKLMLLEKHQPQKGELLDIGAGTGDFLKAAQDDGWNISGFEPNEKAKSLAQQKGVNILSDLKTLPKGHFDVITMWHVLEHVPNLFEHINLLKSLLKETGTLLIAVPNYNAVDAKYYGKFWAAYDVPRHLWHFSPKGISKLFSQFDFVNIKQYPMIFDSFYVSLLSEKYKKSPLGFLPAFAIGLWSNIRAKRSGNYSSVIYVFEHSN